MRSDNSHEASLHFLWKDHHGNADSRVNESSVLRVSDSALSLSLSSAPSKRQGQRRPHSPPLQRPLRPSRGGPLPPPGRLRRAAARCQHLRGHAVTLVNGFRPRMRCWRAELCRCVLCLNASCHQGLLQWEIRGGEGDRAALRHRRPVKGEHIQRDGASQVRTCWHGATDG